MHVRDVSDKVFPAVTFVPGERMSVAQYARALSIDDPVLRSVEAARSAGYRARPVPPAMLAFFLTVSDSMLADELGFRWGHTLNVGIDVQWAGVPVTEEDQLQGQSCVESAWERQGRDGNTRQFLRLRTDFRMANVTVCRWRVLFIEKKSGPPGPDVPHEEPMSAIDDLIDAATPITVPRITDAGGLPGHATEAMDRMSLARLSVAIDNPDPLHIDDEVARKAGFEQVIGQGSAVLGMLHEPIRQWAGLEAPMSMSTQQRRPFTIGDVLRVSGTSTDTDRDHAVTCETTVTAGDSTIASARSEVAVRGAGDVSREPNMNSLKGFFVGDGEPDGRQ